MTEQRFPNFDESNAKSTGPNIPPIAYREPIKLSSVLVMTLPKRLCSMSLSLEIWEDVLDIKEPVENATILTEIKMYFN